MAHLPAARPQHVERLRAGDLMDEVKTDKKLGLAIGELPHGMRIPDFL
jgi:hypothetical protein